MPARDRDPASRVAIDAEAILEAARRRAARDGGNGQGHQSSWRIVDHHRSLLAAAQRDLPPARIRHHHDQAMARRDGQPRTKPPRLVRHPRVISGLAGGLWSRPTPSRLRAGAATIKETSWRSRRGVRGLTLLEIFPKVKQAIARDDAIATRKALRRWGSRSDGS